jgi:hypothetical protein
VSCKLYGAENVPVFGCCGSMSCRVSCTVLRQHVVLCKLYGAENASVCGCCGSMSCRVSCTVLRMRLSVGAVALHPVVLENK